MVHPFIDKLWKASVATLIATSCVLGVYATIFGANYALNFADWKAKRSELARQIKLETKDDQYDADLDRIYSDVQLPPLPKVKKE